MPEDKKTLNKGLDALLGQSNTNQRAVKEIDLNKIKPGRFQPRSNFDNEKLEELTASIKNQGVLSPILVRELGLNEYEVIAGERRLRALNLLSPAITSYSFKPSSLTKIGDNTPWFFIEAVSSSSFSLSKFDLGWNLPGFILFRSISFTALWFVFD